MSLYWKTFAENFVDFLPYDNLQYSDLIDLIGILVIPISSNRSLLMAKDKWLPAKIWNIVEGNQPFLLES